MKILAVETSSRVAGVAITDDKSLMGEYFINHKKTHSQKLMPMIKDVLDILELSANDIDFYAASIGPGSFTGLRIGITTIKGMAFATNKPVVEVNTLDALAYNVIQQDKLICPIIDARNNQVYTAVYEYNDQLNKIIDYTALEIGKLTEELNKLDKSIIFVGDAVLLHREFLMNNIKNGCTFAKAVDLLPRASSVAQIALEKVQKGEYLDCVNLLPYYLRKSQAEREYEKNHKGILSDGND